MTRFDPHTGEPDPFSDSWLDIPLLPDERPRPDELLLYVGIALVLFGVVALWLALGPSS